MIIEDITHGRLYLHCEECEWGWLRPEDSDDPVKGFLTLKQDYESVIPSYDRIRELGWLDYAKNYSGN